jgi:hypothetical protein
MVDISYATFGARSGSQSRPILDGSMLLPRLNQSDNGFELEVPVDESERRVYFFYSCC